MIRHQHTQGCRTGASHGIRSFLRPLACALALVPLLIVPGAEGAGATSNTLTVTATVVASCLISSSDRPLGNDPRIAADVKSNCTTRSAYAVNLARSVVPGAASVSGGGAYAAKTESSYMDTVTVSY